MRITDVSAARAPGLTLCFLPLEWTAPHALRRLVQFSSELLNVLVGSNSGSAKVRSFRRVYFGCLSESTAFMEKYTVSNIYRGNVDFKAMTQNSALQVFFFFFFGQLVSPNSM